jgi:type III pantothenate kinase
MAWLLIDNSNSRTKFRLGDADGLHDWRAILRTDELDVSTIRRLTNGVEFSAVAVASVVPAKEKLIRECFAEKYEYHQLTAESPLGYGFDLESPKQIGHDRLANVLALKTNHGAPGIAIDFGTAITFSVLSTEGKFAGGVIAPGIECMTEYLSSKTAQLPAIKAVAITSAIGKTTVEALQAGAVIGNRGMVREILKELTTEMAAAPVIVATGGGAKFAASGLPEITHVDHDLTLEGLRLLAARVFC